jgi:hypothetical protein
MKKNINSIYTQIRAVKIIVIFICVLFAQQTYSQWSSVGGGMNYNVYTLFVDSINNELYAGGTFTTAGGNPAGHIAKWDGTNWYDVGGGMGFNLNNTVCSFTSFNGEIYAGGLFDSAGGNYVNNIAKWNGSNWSNVGAGLKGIVLSLVVYNGELYAGGDFDSSGTNAVSNIAKWDGTNWVDVGGGTDYEVFTMCNFNNELYIGGGFIYAGGNFVNGIAKWTNSNWMPVGGGGFNNDVYDLYVYSGELYVSGGFTSALNGTQARYITKLVNNTWQVLPAPSGGGIYNGVSDLIEFNGELYVTGRFTNVPYIAKFDGLIYYSLGSGLSWVGQCLAVYNNELYVGGYFSSAIGVSNTSGIAKWNPVVGEFEIISPSIAIGPNPFSNNTIFQLPSSEKSERNLLVYDLLGNLVREEPMGFETNYRFNRENLVAGVYVYSIYNVNGSIEKSGKLLVVD